MSENVSVDMSQHFYRASAADFMKIPGSPVAYWVSKKALVSFELGQPLHSIATPRAGMITGNNALFMRLFHEINFNKFASH